MSTEQRPPYPPEWRDTWFRPGEPGGVPSPMAKRATWAVIVRSVDAQAREEALSSLADTDTRLAKVAASVAAT